MSRRYTRMNFIAIILRIPREVYVTDECTEAQLGLTKIRVGESIYSGFTHNPHRLILDSVIDPKAERGRARGEPEGRSSEHRIASGFTHNRAPPDS